MRLRLLSAVLFSLLFWACGFSTEKRRPDHIEKTMQDRAVKKVSDADVIAQAMELGDSVTTATQQAFMKNLSASYSAGGFDSAVVFCNINALPITDSLASKFAVQIKRVSSQNRNPMNAPRGLEKEIISAYEYSAENEGKIEPNVQFYAKDDSVLFTKPIFVANSFCLNCHGTDETLNDEAASKLSQKYPNDKATGYSVGDFRGMWSVRMLRSDLIKQL